MTPPTCRPLDPLCGNCAYSLLGLPATGACPECGDPYSQDLIVIPGWGWGYRESITNASPHRIFILTAPFILLIFALWLRGVRFAWILIPALAALGLVLIYRRWRLLSDFGVTCHARLSPQGFAQRNGFGPVAYVPWAMIGDYQLVPSNPKCYRLLLAFQTPKSDTVSIEFACTPAQAAWLAEEILRLRRMDDVARLTS